MKPTRDDPRKMARPERHWEPPGWDPDHWREVYQQWQHEEPRWPGPADRAAAWCRHWPLHHW